MGAAIMSRDPEGRSESVFHTRWMSFFGVELDVVVKTWNLIGVPVCDQGELSHAKPEHLLWALLFLKKHGDESEMAALVGKDNKAVDEKTFSKWSKIFVRRIACLIDAVVSRSICLSSLLAVCCFLTMLLLSIPVPQVDCLGEPEERRHWKRLPRLC